MVSVIRARPLRRLAVLGVITAVVLGGAAAAPRVTTAVPSDAVTRRALAALPTVRVVALGDSVTAGTECGCTPYPELYGATLAQRLHALVTVANRSADGWTSADLLSALRDRSTAQALDTRSADVVLVEIGANDLGNRNDAVTSGTCGTGASDAGLTACADSDLRRLRSRLSAIGSRIAALRDGRPTVVAWLDYWNVFQDGDVASATYPEPGLRAAVALTRRANAEIRAEAHASHGVFVDLLVPFRHAGSSVLTSLLADDGDHPDAAGHRLVARELERATLARVGALLGSTTAGHAQS